jgi:hypothetical protein
MTDDLHKSVTRDDLRNALASGTGRAPTNLLSASPAEAPAWEWDGGVSASERLELEELRQLTTEQRERLEELTVVEAAAGERADLLQEAVRRLASASPFKRGAVIAELRRAGLL